MFLIFGLTLVATAVQLYRHRNQDPSVEDNALVGAARRVLPITDSYDDGRMVTHARRPPRVHAAVPRAARDRH